MLSQNAQFRSESESIKSEHQEMMNRLSELDQALEAVVCYSEVYANLAASEEALTLGRWIARHLPEHFGREEKTVLARMAKLGSDYAVFAKEMKRQHEEMRTRVDEFCRLVHELENTNDIEQCVCRLKDVGRELSHFMAIHMGAEESKLAAAQG
jgi:hypothetical protein